MAQHSDRCLRQLAACSVHTKLPGCIERKRSARTAQWGLTFHKRLCWKSPHGQSQWKFPLSKIRFHTRRGKNERPRRSWRWAEFLKQWGTGVVLAPVANFLSEAQ